MPRMKYRNIMIVRSCVFDFLGHYRGLTLTNCASRAVVETRLKYISYSNRAIVPSLDVNETKRVARSDFHRISAPTWR